MNNGEKTIWRKSAAVTGAFLRRLLDRSGIKHKLYLLVYLQPLAIAILTYIVASRFAPIGVDAHHDGIMFKPALDVAEGKMLFRDSFQQYAAFTTLLQALALKIFGHYLLVIRLETAFVYALISCLLWLIWKRLIPQWLATLCGLIFIGMAPYLLHIFFINRSPNYGWWFQPWSSVYALFFQLLSLYLLILFIEKRSWRYLAAAGSVTALTMWSKQPIGALLLCAEFIFIVCLVIFEKFAWRKLLACLAPFLAGFVVVNAVFVVWLLLNHALKDMWLQSVVSVFTSVGRTAPPLSAFMSVFFPPAEKFSSFHTYVWAALPIPCLILFFRTLVNYFWKRVLDTKQLVLFAVVLVCLASWAQYYPALCERHTYWAAAPMFGVFAYFAWDLLRYENIFFRVTVTLLALAFMFKPDIERRIKWGTVRLQQEYVTLDKPKILKGMKVPPHDALFLQTVAADIDAYYKRYPAGGLLNTSLDALFPAYVPGLVNFHPLYLYWGISSFDTLYPDYAARLAKYAQDRRPIVISHTEPVIYKGYTVKSLGRDMYVTAPAERNSSWCITAFRPVARVQGEELAAPRDYSLDLQYCGKNAPAGVRLLGVVAYDFDGVVQGVWQPVTQAAGSIVLAYTSALSADVLKPLSAEFSVPANGKIQVALTGHDFPHYSTALKIQVVVAMGNNTRFKQTINFLPLFGTTPEEFLNRSLQRYVAGDFYGCIQAAESALRLNPDLAMAYNNICASWNVLGQWDKAVAAGKRAVALEPGNVLAKNNLKLAVTRAAELRR